jgi:hypothetical protein
VTHRGLVVCFLLAGRLALAATTLVVRAGDPSPLGLPFSSFSDPSLDDRGRITFVGSSTALFTRDSGGIVRVAAADDMLAGRRIAGVGAPAFDGTCLVFRAAFVGGDAGVFRRCATDVVLVARSGSAAPGGGVLAGIGGDLAVGAEQRVAFTAVLADGTTVLYLAAADGTLQEIVRTGAMSPAGGTFTSFRLLGVSAMGRVGFRGVVSGGPDGLFYWDGTALEKLVVAGDASPAGGSFTTIGLGRMNAAEAWAFRATVSGESRSESRSGAFRASSATLLPVTTVALAGDPTPIGGTFASFPSSLVPAINASGEIAFRATVKGAPYSSASFTATADGTLASAVAVNQPTGAGELVRLREVALADDGGVVVRATLSGGVPALVRARAGRVDTLAALGDATDLGADFRFSDPSAGATADGAIFLGTRDGLFVATPPGTPTAIGRLGDRTRVRGSYASFDAPAAGGPRTAFGASIAGGHTGEALMAAGARGPVVLVKSGTKVRRLGEIVDFFGSALDNLARPGVGGAGVAFEAALGDGTPGIFFWNGGHVRALALGGRHVPGGGTYEQFGTPGAGRGSAVAFVADTTTGEVLVRIRGSRTQVVAREGDDVDPRLPNASFRSFDQPAVSGSAVAFHARLTTPPEGVFVAGRGCIAALAAAGDASPGGGRLKAFGAPAFAGDGVVFRGDIVDGPAASGLFRATPVTACAALPLEALAVAGAPSPVAGAVYLGFGTPAGNRNGAVAVAADLSGGGTGDAIVVFGD